MMLETNASEALSTGSSTPARPTFRNTPFGRLVSEFSESWLAVAGVGMVLVIILAALLAPWLAPQNPYNLAELDLLESTLPPFSKSSTGMVYWLGTDDQGRDMLSAILYGLRTSLGVGVLSGCLAFAIGTALGLMAAYRGGRLDTLLMRFVDLQLSFPAILVALILLVLLGQGVDKIIIALVVVQWSYFARSARGSALTERNKEYIEAARNLGLTSGRIMFRHLLPNALPPLIVIGTVQVAHAITLEATLSFLGIGLPITEPSLGLLIANGYRQLLSGMYWISFYPGIALLITIVSMNLVGDHLRDVLNPRLQR
jgi:peptide/nickel transport system permease protein